MNETLNAEQRWLNLKIEDVNKYTTLRADFDGSEIHHEFYFAKNNDDEMMLLFACSSDNCELKERQFAGMTLSSITISGMAYLELKLHKNYDEHVFYCICRELCYSMEKFDAKEVPYALVKKLVYLQKFFSDVRPLGRLSEEELQGLFAELWVLRNVIIKYATSYVSAVNEWVGITGASQDFKSAEHMIEVKSVLSSNKNAVTISSAEQLDSGDMPLFLAVLYLETSDEEQHGALCLGDLIQELVDILKKNDRALSDFQERLSKKLPISLLTEYFIDQHKSNKSAGSRFYIPKRIIYYQVTDTFPKITKRELPGEIMKVSYKIDLDCCSDFIVTENRVFNI